MGGGPMGGPGYSVSWNPNRPIEGTSDSLTIVRQGLSVGVPVYRADGDMVIVTANVRHTMLTTDAVLPDSKRLFPNELWNVSLGLMGTHRFDNGWTGMAMTSVGSASDRPFASIREMNVTVMGMLTVPARNERDNWLLSVFYNPAGNLNFPIPGVAYQWNPNERLRVNIGLPLSVTWRPNDDLTLAANYIPLTNVTARATYRVLPKTFLYGGYEFLNESYFLADRADRQDRFMAFEQRVVGGIRRDFGRYLALDVHAGYAFGRYFGEGQNQGGDLHDRVDVAAGAFLGLAIRGRF